MSFVPRMQGVAAAAGTNIYCGADWFRQNLSGEAKGVAVHELVHVVQQYDRAQRSCPRPPIPGWVVEGIADYIRWFLYEPETRAQNHSVRPPRWATTATIASVRISSIG